MILPEIGKLNEMPRRKPTTVTEMRVALGTWERQRVETLGVMIGGGALAAGVGVLALPFAIVGGAGLAALLLHDNLEEALEKLSELGDRVTHPNRLGGEEARQTITEELTQGQLFEKYLTASSWRLTERRTAFDLMIGQTGASDLVEFKSDWEAWAAANPLPPMLGMDTGGVPPMVGGCVYQTSIRVTAARRKALSIAGIVNPPALLATLFGSALPGSYYTRARDAPGYVEDTLLDWLAIASFPSEPWGLAIRDSSRTGAATVEASQA